MRVVVGTGVASLAVLCLFAPATARAQGLQNCVQNVSGELPIGTVTDPGYGWKKDIVTWLTPQGVDAFAWVEPLSFVDPVEAYVNVSAPNGNLCSFVPGPSQVPQAPWQALGPDEQLHVEQLWLLVKGLGVPWSWFNHGPELYTLDEMKRESDCSVRTPGLAWGDSLAFFANWEYVGNPFRPGTGNSEVLKRRLAAWLGLQMIMLDYAHNGSTGSFAQWAGAQPTWYEHPQANGVPYQGMMVGAELSAQLALMAWTFERVRDVLDPVTDAAMQEALLTYAERVHLWNPYYPQINRGIRSTYGLYYVWEATQDSRVLVWYEAALHQFFDPNLNWIAGGYWRDDYGLDLGYGGACLMAADRVLAEDPAAPDFVRDAVKQSHELIAHLAVPDVDGRWVAPTPFNARTSIGSIRGVAPHVREAYYGGLERYMLAHGQELPFAAASLRDVEVLGPQGTLALDPRVTGFHEHLACLGAGYVGYINTALTITPPAIEAQTEWPSLTRSQDFSPPPTFLEEHHTGLLVDLWDQLDAQPIDALMPVERSGTKIRNFADRFVYGRFDGPSSGQAYAAVLHLGEVGELPGGGESGFGGGQLAYFWTEDGGPTLLGKRKGRSSGTPGEFDDWTQWRTFALHSVFLRTAAGNVTTSSRIVTPTTSVFPLAQAPTPADVPGALAGTGSWAVPAAVQDSQAQALLARAGGQIPVQGRREATGLPITTLIKAIDYQRSFLMSDTGIWVESKLGKSHPAERLNEGWEMFPVWNRDVDRQPGLGDAVILLHSSSQGLVDVSAGMPSTVQDVTMVEILRGHADHLRPRASGPGERGVGAGLRAQPDADGRSSAAGVCPQRGRLPAGGGDVSLSHRGAVIGAAFAGARASASAQCLWPSSPRRSFL